MKESLGMFGVVEGDLAKARRLVVQAHRGKPGGLTASEREFVNAVIDQVSPENFYMDGELLA